jgi:hypothetical protein
MVHVTIRQVLLASPVGRIARLVLSRQNLVQRVGGQVFFTDW